ncbi:glycosyltransferase [Treponema pedis]|uniref:glycosyltransferase n=1 Tax=Treponema pedis TaxID=409322 RepID=UPI003D203901
MMTLSVLISVYYKEQPNYLDECFKSLYEQTYPANEIVCVKDGTLTSELDSVLLKWEKLLPLKIVGYEENKGLAHALNFGLSYCTGEWIARMDTDDISLKDRFEKQSEFIANNPSLVLFSGYVAEFYTNPDEFVYIKRVPLTHDKICKYAQKRNPFNHMAVCVKKDAVLAVGNYQDVPFFEDYDLWVRLIQAGYMTANMPCVLVYARIGNDMLGRRVGLSYAKKELFFLRRQIGRMFITKRKFVFLCFVRVFVRLLPKKVLKIIYQLIRW